MNYLIHQTVKRVFIATLGLSIASCSLLPTLKPVPEHKSRLNSLAKIIEINHQPVEGKYSILLPPGEHQLVVIYQTLLVNYQCEFEFTAQSGRTYEITDHVNQEPITLYWLQQNNAFWSHRLEPVSPLYCDTQKRLRNDKPED